MYDVGPKGSCLRFAAILLLLPLTAIFVADARAQDEPYQPSDSPPPLKLITEPVRKRLEAETEVKKRTKAALELMGERLNAASARSEESDFAAMFAELGVFHAIMDNTLAFLDRSSRSRGNVAKNYKRFEIGLRQFIPRIEVLRRNAPSERERYLRYLARNVRDARARAIEPLFGDTVLPDRPPTDQ